jgi:hypothetical protein
MSARQFASAASASTFLGTIGLPSKLPPWPYQAVQGKVIFWNGLNQPSQHYQHCRQTQNCHCEKYHRVGRHLCQKLDHLPLLGDLGRSVGVVKAVRQS